MTKDARSPEALLASAEERLAAAQHLLAGGFVADSVGRAYYAMFDAARALLATRKLYPRTHKGVLAQFGLEVVKKGFVDELQGSLLSRAKERREEIAYGDPAKVTREEARAILEDAERFVERAREAIAKMGLE